MNAMNEMESVPLEHLVRIIQLREPYALGLSNET